MFWQRVASLVKFYTNQKIFLLSAERPRYMFSVTALRCVTQDLKAAVFPVKSRKIKEMRTRDKGKLFRHSFRSFIYSLPTQQDCVLPVVSRTVVTSKFKIRWFPNI